MDDLSNYDGLYYGLSTSEPSTVSVSIATQNGKIVGTVEGQCPKLYPWGVTMVVVEVPLIMQEDTVYRYTVTTGHHTQHPLTYETYIPKPKKEEGRIR